MKAVILAGGFGKRLKPVTDDRPKPMIEIGGTPILGWQINWLATHGIKDIVLCVGYLKESIIQYVGSGEEFGANVHYVNEEEPLGTGGALKNAEKELSDGPFVVTNGDIMSDLNPKMLLEAVKKGSIGAIAVVPLKSPFGIVDVDNNGVILGFREKPTIPEYWINAGIYCLQTDVFKHLPKKGNIESTVFPELAKKGNLKAVKYLDVKWRSIDTHKDIEEAQHEFAA